MKYLRQIKAIGDTNFKSHPWEPVEAPSMKDALLKGVRSVSSLNLEVWIAEDKPENRHKKIGHPICVHQFIHEHKLLDVKKRFSICLASAAISKAIAKAEGKPCS